VRVFFTQDAWNFRACGVFEEKRRAKLLIKALNWPFLAFGIVLADIQGQIELTLATKNSARSIGSLQTV
jgi:hypothetical protein